MVDKRPGAAPAIQRAQSTALLGTAPVINVAWTRLHQRAQSIALLGVVSVINVTWGGPLSMPLRAVPITNVVLGCTHHHQLLTTLVRQEDSRIVLSTTSNVARGSPHNQRHLQWHPPSRTP